MCHGEPGRARTVCRDQGQPSDEEGAAARFERRTGIGPADLDLIARVPLFAGLKRASLVDLLTGASARRYPRGAVLFLQDEPAKRFYIVLEGWVKLYRETPGGQESVIAVFTRGDSFAEEAMFESGVFPVNASAVDDARLVLIPADRFIRRLREDPDLCLNIMASMSRHLRHLVQQVEQVSVKASHERLAGFLVGLCPRGREAATVRLPFDKALLAARLNMQPETLSRSLARLRELGVETRRGEVVVRDVGALRRVSQGDEVV